MSSSLGNIDYASQKLVGRSSETRFLKKRFEQAGESPLAVFVKGPSGSGKSMLVQNALDEDNWDDCIFLSGKFDKFQSGDAYSVLVEAFSSLSRKDAQSGTSDMRKSLREQSALLQIIPSLQVASALGHSNCQDEDDASDDNWGFGLLKMLLKDFLRKLCKLHKTVLFLDDLQWCDESYIELISSFLNDVELKNFMFVGAIRTEETSSRQVHDGINDLESLACSTTLHISNLELCGCNEIIANLLRMDPQTTIELATVVHKKTDGNAFFIMQFLQMLERSKLLQHSIVDMKWHFDVEKIEGETSLADNLVGAVISKIQQLPIAAQEILKVAACLGGRFDPIMVKDLVRQNPRGGNAIDDQDISQMLSRCMEEGLITAVCVTLNEANSSNENYYRFAHDKIQQASYYLIPKGERAVFHLKLGRILRKMLEKRGSDLLLLITVRQLNRGRHLISHPRDKRHLAQLNLVAARTLKKKSAFFPSSDFIDICLELLEDESWNNYKLYLEALTTGAELDYCCGNAVRCQIRVEEILAHGQTLNDKLRAYFRLVDQHTLNLNYNEALSVGYELLKNFGVDVERKGRLVSVAYEFMTLVPQLKKTTDDEFHAIPQTEDEDLITTFKMLQALLSAAYWTKRDYEYGYMVIIMMKLTLRKGMTYMAGAIFSSFAGVCGALGEFELARRLGRVGQELDRSVGDKSMRCKSMFQYYMFVSASEKSFYLSLDPFLEAHRIGMEVGDLDHSGLCSFSYVMAYYFAGLPLVAMAKDAKMFSKRMTEYGQWQQLSLVKLFHQTALNLMGEAVGAPTHLQGLAVANLQEHLYSGAAGDIRRQQFCSSLSMQLAYYFRDVPLALQAAKDNESFQDSDWPGFHTMFNPFFRALIWIDAARGTKRTKRCRTTYLKKAGICIRKMEKGTKQGMTNLHHVLLIAKAELQSLGVVVQGTTTKKGNDTVKQVRAAFDEAASVSTRSGFLQNAALTNELAGRSMFRHGDCYWGLHYMRKAVELYREWGADAKVRALTLEFEFTNQKQKYRRSSLNVRGRTRFEEADQSELHKGHSPNGLWSIAVGSEEFQKK